jgi:protein gp37
MATRSSIEWTDMTWNPVTGCTKVSAGCRNCYAERMALRLQAMGQERYARGFSLRLHWDLVDLPYSWSKPKRVFINSMSDLFHPDVPDEFIRAVFKTMSACPIHQFQLLTKRSARLRQMGPSLPWRLNIWAGVSVENEEVAWRVDDLREVPASVRFLSCEPLIGPLDALNLSGIDWVIVGGESGPGARPMKKSWVDSILRQCRSSDVSFFFKQWGGRHKARRGRLLNGATFDEMPLPRARQRLNTAVVAECQLTHA